MIAGTTAFTRTPDDLSSATSSREVRSAVSPVTPPPCPPPEGEGDIGYFEASCETSARERATAMTRSPRLAKASTIAVPSAPVAPMITARSGISGMIQLVTEEKMRFVAPHAAQPASFRRPSEVHAADHPEGLVALPLEHGRDRQEQLIDPVLADQLPKELGTTFRKDGAIALAVQRIEDVVDVDRVGVGNGSHLAGLRQDGAKALG